jgi:hypothetical protein
MHTVILGTVIDHDHAATPRITLQRIEYRGEIILQESCPVEIGDDDAYRGQIRHDSSTSVVEVGLRVI